MNVSDYIENIVIIFLLAYVFFNNLAASILLLPYLYLSLKKASDNNRKKRKVRLAVQFRDGMQAVVAAINAGYSIENAFRESLNELEILYGRKSGIYKEFSKIVRKIGMNSNIEDVLDNFATSSEVEEIICFAEIFRYAKRNGGDLYGIIRNTVNTISDKVEVKRDIDTVTSSKRFEQKIMNYVPVGIILYMRVTSYDMFSKLYSSSFGLMVMTVCLVVYVLSKYLSDRIIQIEV